MTKMKQEKVQHTNKRGGISRSVVLVKGAYCRAHAHGLVAGFTLIETLVAIAILLTAIAGPMSIAHQGAVLGRHTRDETIASYLAQDAIEYVRYQIATNGNANLSNLTGLGDCASPGGCEINTFAGNISPYTGSGNVLLWNGSSNTYGYGSGDPSPFKRRVVVVDTNTGPGSDYVGGLPAAGVEYLVTVTVTWNNGAESVEISDRLVDWRIVL
jgi:prepilin-type N-terminal cleavage/methylation domain-containing protein